MILRKFSFLVVVRISLITVNLIVIASIFGDDRLFFNQMILSTILLVQVFELIRFVNTTNRDLTKFINAIRQSDFTINFSKDELGKSFTGLFDSMSVMLDTYKKVKIEKEAQFHLMQQIISHVSMGIIVIENKTEIILINESARNILKVPFLKTWKGLETKLPEFVAQVKKLPGDDQILMRTVIEGEKIDLSLNSTRFTLLDNMLQLITFSDIKSEIEQKEIEAWLRLIRILTHEIMNSVTPISSLSETMRQMLEKGDHEPKEVADIDNEVLKDILFSTNTIHKRSEGLLEFVEDYRKLTKVPKPDLIEVDIKEMLEEIYDLMSTEISQRNIDLKIEVDDTFIIELDKNLVTQIVINLIKNSFDALANTGNKQIVVDVFNRNRRKVIAISDNGSGIDQKDIEDIWVPFFTTKKEGSGIGLSLSRQIMKLHGGKIRAHSVPGKETTFSLEFRE